MNVEHEIRDVVRRDAILDGLAQARERARRDREFRMDYTQDQERASDHVDPWEAQ